MNKTKIFTSKVHYGLGDKASYLSASPSLIAIFSLKNAMTLENILNFMQIYSVISSVIIYIYIYIYILIGKKEKKRSIGNINLNQPNLHTNSLKLGNHGSSLGKKTASTKELLSRE